MALDLSAVGQGLMMGGNALAAQNAQDQAGQDRLQQLRMALAANLGGSPSFGAVNNYVTRGDASGIAASPYQNPQIQGINAQSQAALDQYKAQLPLNTLNALGDVAAKTGMPLDGVALIHMMINRSGSLAGPQQGGNVITPSPASTGQKVAPLVVSAAEPAANPVVNGGVPESANERGPSSPMHSGSYSSGGPSSNPATSAATTPSPTMVEPATSPANPGVTGIPTGTIAANGSMGSSQERSDSTGTFSLPAPIVNPQTLLASTQQELDDDQTVGIEHQQAQGILDSAKAALGQKNPGAFMADTASKWTTLTPKEQAFSASIAQRIFGRDPQQFAQRMQSQAGSNAGGQTSAPFAAAGATPATGQPAPASNPTGPATLSSNDPQAQQLITMLNAEPTIGGNPVNPDTYAAYRQALDLAGQQGQNALALGAQTGQNAQDLATLNNVSAQDLERLRQEGTLDLAQLQGANTLANTRAEGQNQLSVAEINSQAQLSQAQMQQATTLAQQLSQERIAAGHDQTQLAAADAKAEQDLTMAGHQAFLTAFDQAQQRGYNATDAYRIGMAAAQQFVQTALPTGSSTADGNGTGVTEIGTGGLTLAASNAIEAVQNRLGKQTFDQIDGIMRSAGISTAAWAYNAFKESGGDVRNTGDVKNGSPTSFGLFQFHRGGELDGFVKKYGPESTFDSIKQAQWIADNYGKPLSTYQDPNEQAYQFAKQAEKPDAASLAERQRELRIGKNGTGVLPTTPPGKGKGTLAPANPFAGLPQSGSAGGGVTAPVPNGIPVLPAGVTVPGMGNVSPEMAQKLQAGAAKGSQTTPEAAATRAAAVQAAKNGVGLSPYQQDRLGMQRDNLGLRVLSTISHVGLGALGGVLAVKGFAARAAAAAAKGGGGQANPTPTPTPGGTPITPINTFEDFMNALKTFMTTGTLPEIAGMIRYPGDPYSTGAFGERKPL